MITRKEVMAEFLGGAAPAQDPARAAIMAEFTAPPPPPSDDELLQNWVDTQKKPSLLTRSVERLKGAGVDAKNRFDFTMQSPIDSINEFKKVNPENSTISRTRQALGADIIPAVSDVGGDIAATAVREGIPDVAKEGAGYAYEGLKQITPDFIESGVDAVGNGLSSVGGAIGEGLSKWKAASPNSYNAAKEMANIATAFTPAKVPNIGMKTGLKSAVKNDEYKAAQRKKSIAKMLDPDDIVDAANRGQGTVTEADNWLQTRSFEPSERGKTRYAEVEKITKIDPDKSFLYNMNAIEDVVETKRRGLDASLEGATSIPTATVTKDLQDVIVEAGKSPTLVGDSSKAADKIFEAFSGILEKRAVGGSISPKELLQARRDLDVWLKVNSENIFDNTTAARSLAVKSIRNKINERVALAVPDAKVSQSLKEQSDLLTSRDSFIPKAAKEGKNRLSRAVTQVETETGLAPPSTPQATTVNATSLPAMALTGAATLASLGRKKANMMLRGGRVNAWKGLDKLVNNTPEAAARIAALNAFNQDEDEE